MPPLSSQRMLSPMPLFTTLPFLLLLHFFGLIACYVIGAWVEWDISPPRFTRGVFWVMSCNTSFGLPFQSQMLLLELEWTKSVGTPVNTLPYHFESIVHTVLVSLLFSVGEGVNLSICTRTHTLKIWSVDMLWRQKHNDRREVIKVTFTDAFW